MAVHRIGFAINRRAVSHCLFYTHVYTVDHTQIYLHKEKLNMNVHDGLSLGVCVHLYNHVLGERILAKTETCDFVIEFEVWMCRTELAAVMQYRHASKIEDKFQSDVNTYKVLSF